MTCQEAAALTARVLPGVNQRIHGAIRILEAFQGDSGPPDDDVLQLVQNALSDAIEVVEDEIKRLTGIAAPSSDPPARVAGGAQV